VIARPTLLLVISGRDHQQQPLNRRYRTAAAPDPAGSQSHRSEPAIGAIPDDLPAGSAPGGPNPRHDLPTYRVIPVGRSPVHEPARGEPEGPPTGPPRLPTMARTAHRRGAVGRDGVGRSTRPLPQCQRATPRVRRRCGCGALLRRRLRREALPPASLACRTVGRTAVGCWHDEWVDHPGTTALRPHHAPSPAEPELWTGLTWLLQRRNDTTITHSRREPYPRHANASIHHRP
jgi:hypothetical protein